MSNWTDDRPVRTPGLSAKEEILARVRTALAVPRRDTVTEAEDVPRLYQRADDKQETATDPAKIRELLVKRLGDYTAVVHRTTADGLSRTVVEALGDAATVVVPPGLPAAWTDRVGARIVRDDGTLGPHELDDIDAVVTGCHTAIALTGTLVLRGDELGGRRILSLVPDLHVVVVEAEQIALGVPRAIERMAADPTAPWTMISGPSATSDIELDRVEGVHGPRRLHIVLVEPETTEDPDAPAPSPDRPAGARTAAARRTATPTTTTPKEPA